MSSLERISKDELMMMISSILNRYYPGEGSYEVKFRKLTAKKKVDKVEFEICNREFPSQGMMGHLTTALKTELKDYLGLVGSFYVSIAAIVDAEDQKSSVVVLDINWRM